MKRSPMTLKKAFSTFKRGSCLATATASLYCAGVSTPGWSVASFRRLYSGMDMNCWIVRCFDEFEPSIAWAIEGVM